MMDTKKKLELIKRNTFEIIGGDKIKDFMKKGVVYCGYEVSGEIHLGHLVTNHVANLVGNLVSNQKIM